MEDPRYPESKTVEHVGSHQHIDDPNKMTVSSKVFSVVGLGALGTALYLLFKPSPPSPSLRLEPRPTSTANALSQEAHKLPACMSELRQRKPRDPALLRSSPDAPPVYCGLELDTPPPKHQPNEDYRWVGYGSRQDDARNLHFKLDPYREQLAHIVIDNSNQEIVIVFYPPVKDGEARLAKLSRGLEELKIRVRESCRTRAQMDCAQEVLEKPSLWSKGWAHSPPPRGRKYQYIRQSAEGYFRVTIADNDTETGKMLEDLLGDMVRIKVQEKLDEGERHGRVD